MHNHRVRPNWAAADPAQFSESHSDLEQHDPGNLVEGENGALGMAEIPESGHSKVPVGRHPKEK